jgi:hypothetical protein
VEEVALGNAVEAPGYVENVGGYGRLWGELAARRLAPQQYEAALRQLMVRDAYARSWMIDPHTGQWLVYDGRAWIPARPY